MSGQYFVGAAKKDINTIFDKTSPGTTDSTNFKVTVSSTLTDLNRIYTPLGTNSNLKWNENTNFKVNSIDLTDKFALNIINTSFIDASFTRYTSSDGIILVVTSSGGITFNYPLYGIGFKMIGGGGGGGGNSDGNAGGGGGGGGYLAGNLNTTIDYLNVSIGSWGAGGAQNANGSNGGNTFIQKINTFEGIQINNIAIVNGGGGGGKGKETGNDGGCGGGAGSWSNGSTAPGSGIAGTFLPAGNFNITTNGYFAGGESNRQKNDSGAGGGGGGSAAVGSNSVSQKAGNGGAGAGDITNANSTVICRFSGGGGGGAGDRGDGDAVEGAGANGAGAGGGHGAVGNDASGNPYFGGGGGGAANTSSGGGGNGARGVVVLFISQSMVQF